MENGQIIEAADLVRLAKEARIEAGHTQEQTAELLNKTQPQISGAEKGESRYQKTCMEMIAAFTDFELEGPAFKLKGKST